MTASSTARRATDAEVATWNEHGWVLLGGLIDTDTIDAAARDLRYVFPKPERFHADPDGCRPAGRTDADLRFGHPPMPDHGPAFRPEQHRWNGQFPFYGEGGLNRLAVHPSIVDFVTRALGTSELRLYQTQVSAKYTGDADYEQPLHTDDNHSFLARSDEPPWWHVEMFLYLSDVDDDCAPTHLVSQVDAGARREHIVFPEADAALYAAERGAPGPRGSLLAYRNNVYHRAVDLTRPGGWRYLLNASYRRADAEWIGYHAMQSRNAHPNWVQFVEESTPDELALFGFPPPGHPVWTAERVDGIATRYPRLNVAPWRAALRP